MVSSSRVQFRSYSGLCRGGKTTAANQRCTMAKEGNLLIVDDNSSILGALRLLLERHFAKVTTLTSPKLLDTVLRGEAVDAVLLDMNFTAGVNNGNEGIYWLRRIRDIRPDVKVVLFTAYADVDLAVRSMRDGAVDFVVKPWDNERLVASLRNACELARSQREVKRLREIRRELTVDEPMFWGTSPAMERIREIVEKVAATDANILITGENGTARRCWRARFTAARIAVAVRGGRGYGCRARDAVRKRTVRPREGCLHRCAHRPCRKVARSPTAVRSSSMRSATCRCICNRNC